MLFIVKRLLLGSLGFFAFRFVGKLLLQLLLYLALMVILSGVAGSLSQAIVSYF